MGSSEGEVVIRVWEDVDVELGLLDEGMISGVLLQTTEASEMVFMGDVLIDATLATEMTLGVRLV